MTVLLRLQQKKVHGCSRRTSILFIHVSARLINLTTPFSVCFAAHTSDWVLLWHGVFRFIDVVTKKTLLQILTDAMPTNRGSASFLLKESKGDFWGKPRSPSISSTWLRSCIQPIQIPFCSRTEYKFISTCYQYRRRRCFTILLSFSVKSHWIAMSAPMLRQGNWTVNQSNGRYWFCVGYTRVCVRSSWNSSFVTCREIIIWTINSQGPNENDGRALLGSFLTGGAG